MKASRKNVYCCFLQEQNLFKNSLNTKKNVFYFMSEAQKLLERFQIATLVKTF